MLHYCQPSTSEAQEILEGSRNKSKSTETTVTELIDKRIADLRGWHGDILSKMRKLIQEAAPDVVEEVKWKKPSNSMLGVPV